MVAGGSAPGLSTRAKVAVRALMAFVGVLVGAGVGEVVVRLGLIPPARQIVRNQHVRSIHGVPIWESGVDREHTDCASTYPGRHRVAFFGNSITYGVGMEESETFAGLLETRLNASHPVPGFCVMNFASPAYRFGQKYAMASDVLPRYRPDVALYQDWDMEWGGVGCPPSGEYPLEYTRVGDEVFSTMGLRLHPDGLPGMSGVPDGLNHLLFTRSYLYQYLTLAKGEPSPPPPFCPQGQDAFRVHSLRRFTALARSVGAHPVFFIAADLTYPLHDTHPEEMAAEQAVLDMGQTDHVTVLRMRAMLADQDNTAIRMDSFHYNRAGHQVLAERFEPVVLAVMAQPP